MKPTLDPPEHAGALTCSKTRYAKAIRERTDRAAHGAGTRGGPWIGLCGTTLT